MKIGKPKSVKCPSCGEVQLRHSLMSGNTLGAKYYSDGESVAPMLPHFPSFVKCPKCGVFFRIKKDMLEDGEGLNVPYVKFLTVEEYQQAISEGLFNMNEKDDMLALRCAMWRAFNDRSRKGEPLYENDAQRQAYENNCREILNLLGNPTADPQRLLQADLLRNLGDFKKAKSVLAKIKEREKFERTIISITAACDEKNTYTVRIIDST